MTHEEDIDGGLFDFEKINYIISKYDAGRTFIKNIFNYYMRDFKAEKKSLIERIDKMIMFTNSWCIISAPRINNINCYGSGSHAVEYINLLKQIKEEVNNLGDNLNDFDKLGNHIEKLIKVNRTYEQQIELYNYFFATKIREFRNDVLSSVLAYFVLYLFLLITGLSMTFLGKAIYSYSDTIIICLFIYKLFLTFKDMFNIMKYTFTDKFNQYVYPFIENYMPYINKGKHLSVTSFEWLLTLIPDSIKENFKIAVSYASSISDTVKSTASTAYKFSPVGIIRRSMGYDSGRRRKSRNKRRHSRSKSKTKRRRHRSKSIKKYRRRSRTVRRKY